MSLPKFTSTTTRLEFSFRFNLRGVSEVGLLLT